MCAFSFTYVAMGGMFVRACVMCDVCVCAPWCMLYDMFYTPDVFPVWHATVSSAAVHRSECVEWVYSLVL